VHRRDGDVESPKGERRRRLHKAFLRYHDPNNWPLLREALRRMGREDLIGNGKRHLVPSWQPGSGGAAKSGQPPQRKGAEAPRPGKSKAGRGAKQKPGKRHGR
jgi:hypothetical protein